LTEQSFVSQPQKKRFPAESQHPSAHTELTATKLHRPA